MSRSNYVVISSIGDENHVLYWANPNSTYDYAIAYYGNEKEPKTFNAKYFLTSQGFKFPNYVKLFDQFPKLLHYDYLLFIDDDLILSQVDVGNIFFLAEKYKLDLCQPSLSESSQVCWQHLICQKGAGTKEISFVEIQCFCVSQAFLRTALPFFYMGNSGFGVDIAFFHILQNSNFKSAILNDVVITHPKRRRPNSVRRLIPDFYEKAQRIVDRIDYCFGEKNTVDLLRTLQEHHSEFSFSEIRRAKYWRFLDTLKKNFLTRYKKKSRQGLLPNPHE